MRALLIEQRSQETAPARHGSVAGFLRPVGRFTVHFLEMCGVMCLGAIVLSVLFFGAAGLLGYTDAPQRLPELSVLVVAVNLSLPMAAWMRFRGMEWRPTLEMSGSSMVVGVVLIAAYWLDMVAKSSLIEVQASLACPVMLAVMLFRFRLYSGHAGHHAQAVHRGAPFPRTFARFNRKIANPVMRPVAGWLPPFAIIRHRGRVTGRNYATPVVAFGTRDGLVCGVLYGTTSDWVSNVLVAGRVEVERLGTVRKYRQPRLVDSVEGLGLVPAIVRGPFRILGVRNFLRLTMSPPHSPSA